MMYARSRSLSARERPGLTKRFLKAAVALVVAAVALVTVFIYPAAFL